jgi:NhaP-type Na+/H+ or K+/H+ antiporter
MTSWALPALGITLLAYALTSQRLSRSWVSSAMCFTAAGVVLGPSVLGVLDSGDGRGEVIKLLAEATLAVVLFSDAAKLDTGALRRDYALPARLLGIGLPLTIVLGTLAAAVVFPGLGFWEAAVLAIVLAPTDAALGQVVVSDERLPLRLRQGLNVESGLNDGICVPLLFAALAVAEAEAAPSFDVGAIGTMIGELAVAIAIGTVVGAVVAVLLRRAELASWSEAQWVRLVPIAATLIAYTVTDHFGGSGFIASFVGGLVFGIVLQRGQRRMPIDLEHTVEYSERSGSLLSALTFVLFGAILVGPQLDDITWQVVLYAVLSLTLVRIVPVGLSLGRGAAMPTRVFAGWFGPRGLASIVFVLTMVQEADLPGSDTVVLVATMTVLLSVVLHGLSAAPLTARYSQWHAARVPVPQEVP